MIFQRPPAGSLARRFALTSAALAAIALAVTALFSLWIVGQQHNASLRTLLQKEVEFDAAMVGTTLQEISSYLSEVADNTILATALVDSAGKQAYLTPYLNSIRKINGVPVQVLFTDFEGKEIADNGPVHFSGEQLAWLRMQIESGQETAAIFPAKDGPELVVVELLTYSRTATPEGAVMYKLALNELQRNLRGTLVWHQHDLSAEPESAARISVGIDLPSNLAGLGFHIHANPEVSRSDQLHRQYLIIFLITCALAIAVLVVGSRMALRITKDLRRLEAFATGMIGSGFSKQRADEHGSTEVASLARSINHMLDNLYDQHTRLQYESEKLRELANTIPQLAWMADPDGHAHWYNDRWYAYTDTTPQQTLGWGWGHVIDPQVLPAVIERWKASLATGDPFEMTVPIRSATGEYHPFFTRAAPLRNAAGDIIQWFGTNTDVSPLERAERAVRESEERLREGLTAARMAVWDWDLATWEMKFSANAYDLFGNSLNNMSAIMSSIHPDDLPVLREKVDMAIAKNGQFDSAMRIAHPDTNETMWLEVRGKVHRNHMRKAVLISGVALDITERKRAEEELRAADRRKDEFLAMLAHELRNPLAPIRNGAELLNMLQVDDPRVKMTSDIIARQVDHMTGLVDDLLDVSRVTRGLVTLEREVLDLRDIISSAVEQVRALVDAKEHRLMLPRVDGMQVFGDRTRLIQVLANLLNNSAKYTPNGGSIAIHVESEPDAVTLKVRDTGVGISSDLLPHVFELFSQAERSPDRSQGGLGLGLALVKSLIELHGGSVTASSNGIGKGSEFTMRLPRPANMELSGHSGSGPAQVPSSSKLRILVVDDNIDAANSIAMLLETWGHSVSVEFNAHSALRRAAEESPQALLLDIGLPDMDGYALAARLRQMPQTANAMLIAVTGYGKEEDRQRSHDAGFDFHLVKPTSPAQLADALARVSLTIE